MHVLLRRIAPESLIKVWIGEVGCIESIHEKMANDRGAATAGLAHRIRARDRMDCQGASRAYLATFFHSRSAFKVLATCFSGFKLVYS